MTASDLNASSAAPNRRRLSPRTIGLIAAAAATGSLGFAAVASAGASTIPATSILATSTGNLESSVIERGKDVVIDIFDNVTGSTDGSLDDCPGCGMG